MKEKFVFPNRGIHIVANKIGEADYFLELLKKNPPQPEFNYLFSAYVSALRSITFSLQYVMSKYPGFNEWYKLRQDKLRSSKLAKAFVEFRNQTQKTGIVPIISTGLFDGIIFQHEHEFYIPSDSELKEIPDGNVLVQSENCLIEILNVVAECYAYFDIILIPLFYLHPEL